jgi:(E)-4-hydroxy-3-methylbut-2-enyl-diphosphate synthase
MLAREVDYPFHVGITEAGGLFRGAVKSAAGMGILLSEGLADTIRVSLTAPPEEEVRVAYFILQSLGLRTRGVNFVSCPICGRAEVDMMKLVPRVERALGSVRAPLTVALMGCMVNGPGEAREADIGLACGRGVGVLFRNGKLIRRLREDRIISEFIAEVRRMAAEKSRKAD